MHKLKILFSIFSLFLTITIHTFYNAYESVLRGKLNAAQINKGTFDYVISQVMMNHNPVIYLWGLFFVVMAVVWYKKTNPIQ